jgi:hypothetical protein
MQQTRDEVRRSGQSFGRELLIAIVRSQKDGHGFTPRKSLSVGAHNRPVIGA